MVTISATHLAAQPAAPEAAKFHWKEARSRFVSAGNLAGEGKFREAREVLERAKTELAAPYAIMASLHLGNLSRVEFEWGRDDERPSAKQLGLGRICLELGAYRPAAVWLERRLAADREQDPHWRKQLAYCYAELGRTNDALAVYEQLLRDTNRNELWGIDEEMDLVRGRGVKKQDVAFVTSLVATCHLRSDGAHHKAFAALDLLERTLPTVQNPAELTRLYYTGLECLKRLGDNRGQLAWETDLVAHPSSTGRTLAEISMRQAQRAYDHKNLPNALRGYRLARDHGEKLPLWGVAQFNVGHVLMQLGRFDEALAEHGKLIESGVNDRDPGGHLMETNRNYRHRALLDSAKCYEAQGKFDKALACLVLARDKHRYTSWCGTCAEIAKQHIERRMLELTLLRDAK